jgi:putative protease
MKNDIELLAPGGDIHSIKAALLAGAQAIYCGLDKFNARNRAENITFATLPGIVRLAHAYDCAIFLTLNIVIVESELPAFFSLLNKLVNTQIDGIIIQDLGMLYLTQTFFPSLPVHASTQLTTHNEGQIAFLHRLGAERVNLCRELNLDEIRELTRYAHTRQMQTEVFVHGSNCVSFSGLCYASSVHNGNSGNRGRCSQPCRDAFDSTDAGKNYPLNMKDNAVYAELDALCDAGVDSLKIEGRIKSFDYVFSVIDRYRQKLDRLSDDGSMLRSVFNRDLTAGYIKGQLSADMFTDNPRDQAAAYGSAQSGQSVDAARATINRTRQAVQTSVQSQIDAMSIDPIAITLHISGTDGTPLTISVCTPSETFTVTTKARLRRAKKKELNHDALFSRLKPIIEAGYHLHPFELCALAENLTIPFREITQLRAAILAHLTGTAIYPPVDLPKLKHPPQSVRPKLAVLINHPTDLAPIEHADLYFQLPSSLGKNHDALLAFFIENPTVTPWFPALLIGEEYSTAIRFLTELNPAQIVTNNSGVAFEASTHAIPWIAGPQMNLTNSYSLLCLKEKFNCAGAFLSNELSRNQIGAIKKPDAFQLFYRIYGPIELMTSRQCLTQQIDGCEKEAMDAHCQTDCARTSTLTNERYGSLFVDKSPGNYHRVYHGENFLNTEILTDIPDRFDHFLIDLSDIQTATTTNLNKAELVALFNTALQENPPADEPLKSAIHPTTQRPYQQGI